MLGTLHFTPLMIHCWSTSHATFPKKNYIFFAKGLHIGPYLLVNQYFLVGMLQSSRRHVVICHVVMSSRRHVIMSLCCHVIISSGRHVIMLSCHHMDISSCRHVIMSSWCYVVMLSYCHVIILSCGHVLIPSCHPVVMFSYRNVIVIVFSMDSTVVINGTSTEEKDMIWSWK